MYRLASLYLLLVYVRLASTNDTSVIYRPNKNETKEILQRIAELKDTLNEIVSPYLKISITDVPQNCVQMQCKVICINGKSEEIEKDIKRITQTMHSNCEILEELHLYNYVFPRTIIPINFLGNYSDKVESLLISSSNVTDFEDGAFGNGIFKKLAFENLKLLCLRRGFFKDVGQRYIQSLTIVQKDTPLVSVCEGSFTDVKYRIKYLSLQAGIPCVRNVTASNVLFNNLAYVDFSYNNLGSGLRDDTFSMLSRVEHLDLKHSNINYLPAYIFQNMESLEYLDLSENHLTTISANIFGYSEIRPELKIVANDNDWDCTCNLKREMQVIYGKQSPIIYCQTPPEHNGWSVFDDRICEEEDFPTTRTTTSKTTYKSTTHALSTTMAPAMPTENGGSAGADSGGTSTGGPYLSSTTKKAPFDYDGLIDLECKSQSGMERFKSKIFTASMDFIVQIAPNLSVDVILTATQDFLGDAYGLIWFNKVTLEYYKMEVNYKEYGFGCFGSISHWTTVDNLVPDVSYTFCVVLRDERTISPFNCKSVHLPGNLGIRYNAWLTRDLRATGISLFVIGIVIFTFIGIAAIFVVLKNKPTLLRGSKRVATTKGSINEIIVLPKDRTLEDLRHKEEMLAKRNSKSIISSMPQRRKSTDSTASYTSYMNANLYEELPAYFKVDPILSLYNLNADEKDHSYNSIPPLLNDLNKTEPVEYAEIPFRHKRTSNDPLPAVPKDEKDKEVEQCSTQALPILEREIDLSRANFAFTHDSSV